MNVISTAAETENVLRDMLAAYSNIQQTMKEVQGWNQDRMQSATHHAHGVIRQGLETGSRPLTSTGLVSLIADCHTIRHREDNVIMDRLQPYLDALRSLISRATQVLGLAETPLPDLDDYTSPEAKKRRRIVLSQAEQGCKEDARFGVLRMLRDPAGSQLSAAEHQLLSTVIPESALLPDISAMHDFYHPNVCLYGVEEDHNWSGNGSVHLGFHATTMLHELVMHRGHMRRFTFVHLLRCMGFGAADINFFVTYVDDTFYRRILCDARVGCLAESFSPRLRVYRGQKWAQLWDCFLVNRHRADGLSWTRMTQVGMLAEAVVQENTETEPQQLIPNTILAALHRRHGTSVVPYDSWSVMEHLVELEAEFLEGVLTIRRGTLGLILDSMKTMVRAWPICLRRVAVLHVRLLVQSLSLLPRCPQLVQSATKRSTGVDAETVAHWLWALVPRTAEDDDDASAPTWTSSLTFLQQKLKEHMCAPSTVSSLLQVCEEISETHILEAAAYRYGEVTAAQRDKMDTHLHNLTTLLLAVSRQDPGNWTDRKRRSYGYSPTEVYATIKQEVEAFCPTEHEALVAERLKQVLDDPLCKDLGGESVTGDSQLRPRSVYPSR